MILLVDEGASMTHCSYLPQRQQGQGLAGSTACKRSNPSRQIPYLHPRISQVFRDLAVCMQTGLGADVTVLFGWDQRRGRLAFLQALDRHWQLMPPWNGHAIRLAVSPAMQKALSTNQPVAIHHGQQASEEETAILDRFQCNALLLVPVADAINRLGVIGLLRASPLHNLAEGEMRLLNALIAQAMSQVEQVLDRRSVGLCSGQHSDPVFDPGDFRLAAGQDLRIPFGNLVNLTQSIEDGQFGELPGHLAHQIARIRASVDALAPRINDLAEGSQRAAERLALHPQWLDMPALLSRAVSSLEILVAGAAENASPPEGAVLALEPPLPPVFADEVQTLKILKHLADTLITELASRHLIIRCRALTVGSDVDVEAGEHAIRLPAGIWVEVMVHGADVGPAISRLDNLVNECYDFCTHETGKGESPIMLFMARRLLSMHGSTLWASSATDPQDSPSIGFSFALPTQPQQMWIGRRWQRVDASLLDPYGSAADIPFTAGVQGTGVSLPTDHDPYSTGQEARSQCFPLK